MKIIYFNYIIGLNAHPAGALAKSKSYIRELQAKGFDIQVNWQNFYNKDNSASEQQFVTRSPFRMMLSRVVHEPYKLLQNVVLFFRQLKKIRTFRPDVIFERLEHCYCSAALLSKLLNIPLVVEADAPVVYEYRTFYGRKNFHVPFLPALAERYTLKQADAVFCISSEMKRYFAAAGINPEKMIVTPNGCNPDMFFPRPRLRRLEEAMSLKGQVVVGWVGSLYGWAGIENLIQLVTELAEQNEHVSFLFVGGGRNRDVFQSTLMGRSFSDRVHLPGSVSHDDVNDYLSCMDIVLAPYPKLDFWYASSMKVFEYMSAGKALITSRIGQLTEVISDGENGLLYEPGDFTDLRRQVQRLIDDPRLRKKLGEQARRTALDHYTWAVLADRMAGAFRSVVADKRKRTA